ncbi:MAG TPA: flagellar hook-associated protein FlgK [Bryobacteraceae bacterium]|nr:flagellar hook-associated protein FlgK [Bryobacteraceae bacterium]
MSNLMSVLTGAGNALDAYQKAMDVVQNNITNANTPGYASQSINLVPQPFELSGGLVGGVAAKGLISARDDSADAAVQQQLQLLGKYQMQAQDTASLSNFFDATGNTGVSADLNQLFQAFSAWSVTPNATTAQQGVLDAAQSFATDVNELAGSLAQTGQAIQGQISSNVQQINQLATQIQQYNIQRDNTATPDPNLDAQLHSELEQLSQLVNFSQITQANGTVTLVLSGGAPLVVGTEQYNISAVAQVPAGAANPNSTPSARILDSNGNDITSQITGGQLGGELDTHNRVLASLLGDATQAGSLNTFAKSVADTINNILESGTVGVQAGAANGIALFTYNNADATTPAASLALNPNITPATLAPVDSSGNANGNALQLASLATSTANGSINGKTFGDYFSGLMSALGGENSVATANQQTQQQVADQTKTQRDQISGVSLDQQALMMLQFQNSYQAAAKMVTVLDELAQSTINMMPLY